MSFSFERGLTSVGMAAYNNGETVARSLQSILQQSCARLEVIVLDSGSTDSTLEICESIAKTDNRVSLIHHGEQRSWYANGPELLLMARGEFFMWADADDRWDHDYVESLKKDLDNPAFSASFGRMLLVDANYEPLVKLPASGRNFAYTSWRWGSARVFRYALGPEAFGHCNLIYALWRTDALRSVKPWDPSAPDDQDIFFVLRVLAEHRIASGSSTQILRRRHRQPLADAGLGGHEPKRSSTRLVQSPDLQIKYWHAFKLPSGYARRYLATARLRHKPAVCFALVARWSLSVIGRLVRPWIH